MNSQIKQIVYVHLLPEFHHRRRSILQRDLTAVAHIKFLKFHTVFYKNNNKIIILMYVHTFLLVHLLVCAFVKPLTISYSVWLKGFLDILKSYSCYFCNSILITRSEA